MVEERRRVNPGRLSGRILRRRSFPLDIRKLTPILRFHLSVELAQWIELDLVQRRLDGRVILRGVIHEYARHGNGEVGGRAHHAGNAGRGVELHLNRRHALEGIHDLNAIIVSCLRAYPI